MRDKQLFNKGNAKVTKTNRRRKDNEKVKTANKRSKKRGGGKRGGREGERGRGREGKREKNEAEEGGKILFSLYFWEITPRNISEGFHSRR